MTYTKSGNVSAPSTPVDDHDEAHHHDHDGHNHHGHNHDDENLGAGMVYAFHGSYDPNFDAPPVASPFVTTGGRWTDGGGFTTTLGGTGGTIAWSLAGAGWENETSFAQFFSGPSVDLGTFLPFDFEAVLQQAFYDWSTFGDIDFVQVADAGGDAGIGTDPTIRIFGGFIDGQSGPNTLAYGYFPSTTATGGDISFDNGNTSFYSDSHAFYVTALHEIGHAIGLNHEEASNAIAVMNPIINTSLNGPQPDDINGVQTVYGSAGADDYGETDVASGAISVDFSAIGTIEASGDEDWFEVDLIAGEYYLIDLEGDDTASGTLPDTYLRGIYDPSETLIPGTEDDDGGLGFNSQLVFSPTTTGTHYISAGGFGSNTGTYTLSVSLPRSVSLFLETGGLFNTYGSIQRAADLSINNELIVVDESIYLANPEDVTVFGSDNLTFDLPDGVMPTLSLAENDFLISLTTTGEGDAVVNGNSENNVLITDEGDDTLRGQDGDDELRGGDGIDLLIGGQGNDTIHGDGGDDRLRGNSGLDTIFGGNGDDRIDGAAGGDLLRGGNDNDVVEGEGGNDTLNGQAGNDVVRGGGGVDTVTGSSGDDRVEGNSGNDNVTGGSGEDDVSGGGGNDTMSGGSGNDIMNGNSGNDIIDGDADNDTMNGGSGDDAMDGGTGDDRLSGDRGTDTLTGNIGEDTFVFGKSSDDDTITDFQDDIDTLEIDDNLYTGTLSVAQVVAMFGTNTASGIFFDFGGGDTLDVIGVGINDTTIVDDIMII